MPTFTRRHVVLGSTGLALLGVRSSAAQEDHTVVVQRLIDEVLTAGAVEHLAEIVHIDVACPDYAIDGFEEFENASIAADEQRRETYDTFTFVTQTVSTQGDWAMAYVRFQGETASGQTEDQAVFYAARFEDGLIRELFF